MYSLINTPDDMAWLRQVHIGDTEDTRTYHSAVIYGNEYWPDSVELYKSADPLVTDEPVIWVPAGEDS